MKKGKEQELQPPPPPPSPQPLARQQCPPPPPPQPQQEQVQRSLYIRGAESLNRTRIGALDIPTICPKSMGWLLYLNVAKMVFPDFQFDTHFNEDEVPRFQMGQDVYYNLEDFSSHTPFSLEPKASEEHQHLILDQIQEKKHRMMAPLTDLKRAYLYGYSFLCYPNTQWVSESLADIKATIGIDNDEILEEHLEATMTEACQTLSEELGENTYFLDNLRGPLDDETVALSITSLSILDVQYAACAILIMKCFEDHPLQLYTSRIHTILNRSIALWAHADIMYSWFIKQRTPIQDYSTRLEENPALLAAVLKESGPQASGSFGNVYRVNLPPGNAWGLDPGNYAFKVSKGRVLHLQIELSFLLLLPYEDIVRLMGRGYLDPDKEILFLITKWAPGGDLSTRMEDLSWEQVRKILRRLAYIIHLVHKSKGICLCDLKPPNILLDENDNPILCDLGLLSYSGDFIGSFCGTPLYNDGTEEASPARDVFAYGVILFQLLTHEVVEQENGHQFGKRIDEYIDQGKDLATIVKEHMRVAGCEGEIARRLVTIGAKCVSIRAQGERPSALEILKAIQKMSIEFNFLF